MTQQTPQPRNEPARWTLLAVWLLAGVCLFSLLGSNPCQRTQEARVLTTAREMCQEGGERWLLPTCNGELRLRKPPLPYWTSAIAFAVSGNVSEWSGRAPSAIFAWLMLGLTYAAGVRFFSWRVGLLGAGLLLTSFLFYRFGRLAESDIPAAMFVTLAIWLFWRLMDAPRVRAWLALCAGLAAGGAFMAKGVPGAFAFVFVLMLGCLQRKWSRLVWALLPGLIAAAIAAAPWYVYVWAKGHWPILQSELDVVAGGEDHAGSIWDLMVEILQASLPWTVLWFIAAGLALGPFRRRRALLCTSRPLRAFRTSFGRLRHSPALQGLCCWMLAILLPLSLSGNKQLHYVMPAMPALMLLTAWGLDRAVSGELSRAVCGGVSRIMLVTLAVFALVGMGLVTRAVLQMAGAHATSGEQAAVPGIVLGAILAVGGAASFAAQWRRGLWFGAIGAIVTCAAAAPVLTNWFGPSIEPIDIRDVAEGVALHEGGGTMVYWQSAPSLPLTFQLKRVVTTCTDPAKLEALAREANSTVLIQTRPSDAAVQMPGPWRLVWRGGPKGHHTQVFRPTGAQGPASTAPVR